MKTIPDLMEKARELQIDGDIDVAYRTKLGIGTDVFFISLFADGSALIEGRDKWPKPLRSHKEINEYARAIEVAAKWIGVER